MSSSSPPPPSPAQNERLTRMENYCSEHDIDIFDSLTESTQVYIMLISILNLNIKFTYYNIFLNTRLYVFL